MAPSATEPTSEQQILDRALESLLTGTPLVITGVGSRVIERFEINP